MNFWETITGGDMNKQWKALEGRAEALPAGYPAV
jgi:DNA-binding ferritin-like protein (Dps family)